MIKIQKFEDILAWQKARELTREIYAHTRTALFAKDFGLRERIQRASVSIMGNVAEGFDRGGEKELSEFISISKGSCAEMKSHEQYINSTRFNNLYNFVGVAGRLLAGFMSYLKQSDLQGRKFK